MGEVTRHQLRGGTGRFRRSFATFARPGNHSSAEAIHLIQGWSSSINHDERASAGRQGEGTLCECRQRGLLAPSVPPLINCPERTEGLSIKRGAWQGHGKFPVAVRTTLVPTVFTGTPSI